MKTKDLTLEEVEEAKRFGLSPKRYCELKAILDQRVLSKVRTSTRKKRAIDVETIETKLEADLRKRLWGEVYAKALAEAKAGMTKELCAALRKEVSAELTSKPASEQQVQSARELIREIEVDHLVLEDIAREQAERLERRGSLLKGLQRTASYLVYVCPIAVLPLLALHFGKQSSAVGLGFIGCSIAICLAFYFNSCWYPGVNLKACRLREDQLEYGRKAQTLHMLWGALGLNPSIEGLESKVNAAVKYRSTRAELKATNIEVQQAKVRVSEVLLIAVDPEKLCRIEEDPRYSEEELQKTRA